MTQIKIFYDATEKDINKWLKEHNVEVIDIKRRYVTEHYNNSSQIYQEYDETMIIYRQ